MESRITCIVLKDTKTTYVVDVACIVCQNTTNTASKYIAPNFSLISFSDNVVSD